MSREKIKLPQDTVKALNRLLFGKTEWVTVKHDGIDLQVSMFFIGWEIVTEKTLWLHVHPVHGFGETSIAPGAFFHSDSSRPVLDKLGEILGWDNGDPLCAECGCTLCEKPFPLANAWNDQDGKPYCSERCHTLRLLQTPEAEEQSEIYLRK